MKQKVVWIAFLSLVLIIGTGLILAYQIKSERVAEEKERVAQEKDLLNQIFFSGVDCTAPCWQGLVPGQSNADAYPRLAEKLAEKGFVFRYESNGDDYTVYSWFDPQKDINLFVHIDSEETIDRITFSKINLIHVENLFAFLGEPDYYASVLFRDIEGVITLDFLYVEKGAVISFEGVYPNQETADCYLDLSKLQVWKIYLVRSSKPNNMLEDSLRNFSSSNSIQPWAGINALHIQGCISKQ